ncbi:MAG: hypothetical protein P1V51_11880 [Deltaproteobacteria bacterium]|nr:hypothetical protein [Deltaproteobacteria bacterium]
MLPAETEAALGCPAGKVEVITDCSASLLDEGWSPDLRQAPWSVSSDGSHCIVEADAGGRIGISRFDSITGLAELYRVAFRVRVEDLVPTAQGGVTLLGTSQDKQIRLDVNGPNGSSSTIYLVGDPVPFSLDVRVEHDFELLAERDGVVTLHVDGAPAKSMPWANLLDETAVPADQILSRILVVDATATYDFIDIEACEPGPAENLQISIRTSIDPGAENTPLRGGTGQTLAGMERLYGTAERTELYLRSDPGNPTTERIVTVSQVPELVILATTVADDSVRPLLAYDTPEGWLTEMRVVLTDLWIDIDGETHPGFQRSSS